MDTPNFYCFCGNVHVLTGTRLIGAIGSLTCSFLISFLLSEQSFCGIFVFAMFCIPFVLLLFADRQRCSKLYLPFLLLNAILICLNSLYLLFIGTMMIWMPYFWKEHLKLSLDIDIENKNSLRSITFLIFIIFLLIEFILFWCHSIVSNAYNYMNEDKIILIPPQISTDFTKKQNSQKNKKWINLVDNRQSQLA